MDTDTSYTLKIKRAYLPAEPEDGCRILVDRLWPRGLSKEKAHLDAWEKAVAPSSDERKKLHQGLEDFEAFRQDYRNELEHSEEAADFVRKIRDLLKTRNITLVYASKDTDANNATVLKEWLEEKLNEN